MSTGFFSIGEDGRLKDVSDVGFEKEDTLQELVAKYPRLLSGIGRLEGTYPPLAVCETDPECRAILGRKFPTAVYFLDVYE